MSQSSPLEYVSPTSEKVQQLKKTVETSGVVLLILWTGRKSPGSMTQTRIFHVDVPSSWPF